MNNNGKKPGLLKALVIYVLIFVVVAGFITLISGGSIFGRDTDTKDIEFSELIGYLDKSQVEEIEINENNRSYVAKLRTGQVVVAYAPSISEMDEVSRAYIVDTHDHNDSPDGDTPAQHDGRRRQRRSHELRQVPRAHG